MKKNRLNLVKYFPEEILKEEKGNNFEDEEPIDAIEDEEPIDAIYNEPSNHEPLERILYKFNLFPEELKNIKNQIKPLKNNKIIKFLNSGTYGEVFLLQNDHVLKIFNSGHGLNLYGEINKFQEMQNRQFNGLSHKGEPAIYDVGIIELETVSNKLGYVEMGKVIPIRNWLTKMNIDENVFDILITIFEKVYNSYYDNKFKINFKEFIKKINSEKYKNIIKKIPLQSQIISEFFKSLYKYVNITGSITDLHAGNFGVLLNRDIKNPVSFVFFDI